MTLSTSESTNACFTFAVEDLQAIQRSGCKIRIWLRHREADFLLEQSSEELAIEVVAKITAVFAKLS